MELSGVLQQNTGKESLIWRNMINPTVNLEAAACGTRVVTYDVGGCRETICRADTVQSGS